MKRSAISILRALRQSSIRTIFHRVSTKVDRTRGINSVRIRSFHSFGRLSLWREIEREREKLSLESLVQFRIVVDCVSGFNRWLTCAREALVRVSAPLLTVAIKLGGTCNSAIRSPTRPWSFPLNIFFRNRNYPFLFFLFFLSNASESSSRNESTRSKIDFLFRGLTSSNSSTRMEKNQWKSVVERANEILFL